MLASNQAVKVSDYLANCEAVSFSAVRGARLFIPFDSNISWLKFYDAPADDATNTLFYESKTGEDSSTGIELAVSVGSSYPIPAKLFGSHAIKMMSGPGTGGTVFISGKD